MVLRRFTPATLTLLIALLVSCKAARTPSVKSGTERPAGGAQTSSKRGADPNWPSVAAVQYRTFEKTHSAEEEADAIGYSKSQGTVLKVREASVTPTAAEAGKSIFSEMEYSVVGPESELEIAEEWQILKDGTLLTSTSPRMESRGSGGWRVSVSIGLPRGAKPGAYVIRSRVSAGQLADSRDAGFTVAQAESKVPRTTRKAAVAETVDPMVMQVQARLKELGHDPGSSDGRMRAQTLEALKSFQKDYGLAATGEIDAHTLAALNLGKPSEQRSCEKAQGTVKDSLRNPAESPGQRETIEICDTGADYRLDGLIVVVKSADHSAFAQAALDDLGNIASISDPSGNVGFDFLIQLLETLSKTRVPAGGGDNAVYIRWGASSKSQPDKLRPVTRPGTSGGSPTSVEWQAATSQGLDVYSDDGTAVGGAGQYFKGLSKGTGSGIGASVFYQPEALPDPKICPAGQTSDIALLHELQHAAHMARGSVDNTPYSSSWWNTDPLAARYGVHEEKFIVERENEYRAALKQKYPSRYPNLRPRQSYLGDC
jgi:peptidoglycan hydrolase-like protein with peptidoglycan-binding domain